MKTLVSLTLALLLAAPAAADVLPEGTKVASVEHHLEGAAKAGDHTLMVLTTNRRYRSYVTTTPGIEDGKLPVQGGYMNRNVLVALTKDQLVALGKLAREDPAFASDKERLDKLSDEELAAWIAKTPIPETDPKAEGDKLTAFFADKAIARSQELPFRTFIDEDDERESLTYKWTLTGVAGGAVKLQAAKGSEGAGGEQSDEGGAAWLILLGVLGAGVVVFGFFLLGRLRASSNKEQQAA